MVNTEPTTRLAIELAEDMPRKYKWVDQLTEIMAWDHPESIQVANDYIAREQAGEMPLGAALHRLITVHGTYLERLKKLRHDLLMREQGIKKGRGAG